MLLSKKGSLLLEELNLIKLHLVFDVLLANDLVDG